MKQKIIRHIQLKFISERKTMKNKNYLWIGIGAVTFCLLLFGANIMVQNRDFNKQIERYTEESAVRFSELSDIIVKGDISYKELFEKLDNEIEKIDEAKINVSLLSNEERHKEKIDNTIKVLEQLKTIERNIMLEYQAKFKYETTIANISGYMDYLVESNVPEYFARNELKKAWADAENQKVAYFNARDKTDESLNKMKELSDNRKLLIKANALMRRVMEKELS